MERGTRSGRIFSSWFLTNQPDPVPLRAPRSFDLEAATAHAESLRDEVEAHAEADAEDRVLYTELDSVSNDVNPLPLPKDTPSSDPTTTAVEPRMSLALDSFQHPQTGPVRSKDARTQHFTAPTRVKYEERRLKLEQEASEGIPSTLESVDQKRVNSSHPLMTSGYNVESTRVGCNSWTGPRVEGEETPISLEDLIQKKNMTLCSWDGKSCRPITDSQERVVAVLAGRPESKDWDGLVSDAAEAIARTKNHISFTDKQLNNGRGEFPAVAVGVSHGGGRKEPGNVSQSSAAVLTLLTSLLELPCFQSLSGFANDIFQAYAPLTFQYYQKCMESLWNWNPDLRRHFKETVFASCTINFGPSTVCRPHTDRANLSFGWCAITALGNFDPDKGGHLILWDLGLVIRFPPGSTILIPLALLTHSNVPIQENETRYSFVLYSAAGLFRWVYNGFKSDADFEAAATSAQSAKREEDRQNRWKEDVNMFSKLGALRGSVENDNA